MGYQLNEDGQCPTEEKTEAIKNVPRPTCQGEFRSYLGMINYYGKFFPRMATMLEPLHALLRKGARLEWKGDQEEAFEKSKRIMCSAQVLAHYDATSKHIIACDASPYRIGAVLLQVQQDGQERTVAYASNVEQS